MMCSRGAAEFWSVGCGACCAGGCAGEHGGAASEQVLILVRLQEPAQGPWVEVGESLWAGSSHELFTQSRAFVQSRRKGQLNHPVESSLEAVQSTMREREEALMKWNMQTRNGLLTGSTMMCNQGCSIQAFQECVQSKRGLIKRPFASGSRSQTCRVYDISQ